MPPVLPSSWYMTEATQNPTQISSPTPGSALFPKPSPIVMSPSPSQCLSLAWSVSCTKAFASLPVSQPPTSSSSTFSSTLYQNEPSSTFSPLQLGGKTADEVHCSRLGPIYLRPVSPRPLELVYNSNLPTITPYCNQYLSPLLYCLLQGTM